MLDRPGGNFGNFCTINVGDICSTLRYVHVHSGGRIYVGFYRNPSNEAWKVSSFRGALTTASSHLCVLLASFMLPFFLLLQV